MNEYSGADVLESVLHVLTAQRFDMGVAAELADIAADTKNTIRRTLVHAMLDDVLAQRAREMVQLGLFDASARLATLAQEVRQKQRVAAEYNLDLRLDVINALTSAHKLMRQLAA
jgi:hypothetical protein